MNAAVELGGWLFFGALCFELGASPSIHPLTVLPSSRPGFTRLDPAATGVTFTNTLSDLTVARNRITENGSGVALGDVDGDGLVDLYVCGLERPNALYRNLGGWRFEDITERAGVACADQFSTGAVLADLDGDGHLDLLVTGLGTGARQFMNDGTGRFTEVTGSRLVRRFGATSLALADVDGDGDLDLYVANYRTDTFKDSPPGLRVEARRVDDRVVVTPEDRFLGFAASDQAAMVVEKGERDFFYLNDGQGRFLPVSWTSGSFLDEDGQPYAAPPTGWGLAAMFRDFNGDGLPDLYVCNDFFHWPDFFWLNEEGRRFRAVPRLAVRSQSMSAMAVDVADFNRDGHDDFLVVDMLGRDLGRRSAQRPDLMRGVIVQPLPDPNFRPEAVRNSLQLARGDGTYAEIAFLAGLAATGWSWSCLFLDVDLDGWEDVLITTGNNHDVQDADALRRVRSDPTPPSVENRRRQLDWFPRLPLPNLAFRNQRDLTFRDMGAEWGFDAVGVSHGMALADLDGDGDLDVVVNNLNGAVSLYRNESSAPRLHVRLRGAGRNTRGIGARIAVRGGPVVQTQEILAGGRYLSSDDPARVFAAGSVTNRLDVEVRWRSGRVSLVTNVPANSRLELHETHALDSPSTIHHPPSTPPPWGAAPLFTDLSPSLRHAHRDAPSDDFTVQPTLSRRLSTEGPGVAWADVDGDGREELLVPGGRAGRLAVLKHANGTFRDLAAAGPTATRAQSLLALPGTNGARLLVAHGNWSDGRTNGVALDLRDAAGRVLTNLLADGRGSPGALALGDVDGDGRPDLFVGGRAVAGRFPEAADSRLLRGGADGFVLMPAWDEALRGVGLVTDALFTDLTGDGRPELVLACDWGSLIIFKYRQGRLEAWDAPLVSPRHTPPSTLRSLTGWWLGLTAGDFDGDGRLDLVAGNWGRNTRFQESLAQPLRVAYADFDGNGITEMIEAVYDPAAHRHIAWRDHETLTQAMPFLIEQVPTFAALGQTDVKTLLGTRAGEARWLEAATLESVVLLNRGDHFERRPLPVEAQFAPVFGIAVADFDGDGAEDLFLAQNFFGVEPEMPRHDAGRGLLLLGDGRGGFRAVPGQRSGIALYGEGRGAAVADYDGDGRPDLAVGQQGGETKLYRNAQGRPGVRVRLAGPPGNPAGLGAQLRVWADGRAGPVREIRAGGGWRSQDSAAVVLARPEGAAEVEIRWPDGHRERHPLPAAGQELVIEWRPATP